MHQMNTLIMFIVAVLAYILGAYMAGLSHELDKCRAPKSAVLEMDQHPELFLMILIISSPNNVDRRITMRDTWLQLGQPLMMPFYPITAIHVPSYDENGHLLRDNITMQKEFVHNYWEWAKTNHFERERRRHVKVKHFFAIGTANLSLIEHAKLKRERSLYGDLLLLPKLIDSYANLSLKMLHSLDALTGHYDFGYLLKVDDDTYVKLDHLLNELVSYDRKIVRLIFGGTYQPHPQLYWGYFNGRANIKTRGQWRESNYILADRYIVYALGGGYVLSHRLCKFVAQNARRLTRYVSEDVSMGTWLSGLRDVYRRHDIRFDTGYMPRKCQSYHIVLHKRNTTQMRDLYAGRLCTHVFNNEQQIRRPIEYYYDWHQIPSRCCDNIVT